jgi:hypothetical protein
MRALKVRLMSATACVALAALFAAPCVAGISVIGQDRTLHIDGTAGNAMDARSFDQTLHATAFMPFSQSIQNQVSGKDIAGNTVTARTSASQTSTIELSGGTLHVSAAGGDHLFSDGTEAVSDATSTYSVTFATDTPAQYTITETTDNPGFDQFFQIDIAATLQPGAAPPVGYAGGFSALPGLLPRFLPLNMPVTFTGTLAPGTYTLEGGVTGGDVMLNQPGLYAVDFSISSGMSAVPLPRSLWMALTTMGLMIPAWLVRRKTQNR